MPAQRTSVPFIPSRLRHSILSVGGRDIILFGTFIFHVTRGVSWKGAAESSLRSTEEPLAPHMDEGMAVGMRRRRAPKTNLGRTLGERGTSRSSWLFFVLSPRPPSRRVLSEPSTEECARRRSCSKNLRYHTEHDPLAQNIPPPPRALSSAGPRGHVVEHPGPLAKGGEAEVVGESTVECCFIP